MPKVNADVMRWARESAGFSLDDASTKLKLGTARGVAGADRLQALESGEDEPSRPMLLKMANVYRRPLIAFYLSNPPRRADRGQDFRRLPKDHRRDQDDALLDVLIRDVTARQSLVHTVLEEEEEAEPLPFVGSVQTTDGVDACVSVLAEFLDFRLEAFRAFRTSEEAFAWLRARAENAGVFVLLLGNLGSHHTAIDLEAFRGFAIADGIAPFVVINDQDAASAWSFTLLHELAHVVLGQTGVSGGDVSRQIEKFCNDVASEVLLPRLELRALVEKLEPLQSGDDLTERIAQLAKERNVSGTMVAYALFKERVIGADTWQAIQRSFRQLWSDHRRTKREMAKASTREGGPSFYVVRRHRLGQALVNLAGRMKSEGVLSTTEAGRLLGVKPKQVAGVLD